MYILEKDLRGKLLKNAFICGMFMCILNNLKEFKNNRQYYERKEMIGNQICLQTMIWLKCCFELLTVIVAR